MTMCQLLQFFAKAEFLSNFDANLLTKTATHCNTATHNDTQ